MQTSPLAQQLCEELGIALLSVNELVERPSNLGLNIDPTSPAYVLFTSGSTGQPKGVVQTHRNVLHFIQVYTNNLHLSVDDKISLLPTYSFDASVMDIYGGLLNGATLCPYNVHAGLESLPQWLQDNRITVFHTVPTIYRNLLATKSSQTLEDIRLVVLGGEAVYKEDFEGFKKHFSRNALFVNGYGPTESTITCQKILDHTSRVTTSQLPIGKPVHETEVYLLTEDGAKAGIYQTGEIIHKSSFLSPGYLNNENLTARVFGKDPTSGEGRVYHSGDYGKQLPTGEIIFIGRKDQQVKLRGYRLELPEIEERLLQIEGITEAVAQVIPVNGEDNLVAHIRATLLTTAADVRKKLTEHLPHFMIPTIIVFVDQFPKTVTGKINRLSLGIPEENQFNTVEFIAPRTETEKQLVSIWQEVLGNRPIGVKDNFFELGGHSIRALQVLSRIRKTFNISFEIREVFGNETIELLAKEIARKEWIAQSAVSTTVDEKDTIEITI
jgi:amino acid adenylation domain-containing protein